MIAGFAPTASQNWSVVLERMEGGKQDGYVGTISRERAREDSGENRRRNSKTIPMPGDVPVG